MAELIARGSPITLEAFTTNNLNVATDASALTVSIEDATGATVLANQTPTHIATGSYQYTYTVPGTGVLGAWEAEWSGTVNGIPILVSDGFTVVEPFQVITPGGLNPTVDDLITETENHLLGGDRDELNLLKNSITDTDLTLVTSNALSGVTDGSYLCIDLEVMYVWSADESSGQVKVGRGWLGSTPTSHAAGATIYVNPLFSKWAIFKQLNTEITDLSSADNGLFRERSFTLSTQSVNRNYIVPVSNVDIQNILEIRWHDPGAENLWPAIDRRTYQIVRDLDVGYAANTGVSIRIETAVMPGRDLVVRYAAPFTPLPEALASDAAAGSGLATSMLDIPPLGAAARLMGVREAKRSFIERSVDTRRAQEVPPGSASRAAGVLLQLLNSRIKNEAARLHRNWPMAS